MNEPHLTDEAVIGHNQAELERLEYVLQQRTRQALIFVSTGNHKKRDEVISRLKTDAPQYQYYNFDLAGKEITSLYLELKSQLPQKVLNSKEINAVVNIFGLEYLIANEIGHTSALIPEINFERELLFREFPCILIFWTDQYTMDRLSKEAGDFWHWVSYQFQFHCPKEELDGEPIPYNKPLENPGYTAERRERIRELEEKLAKLPHHRSPTQREISEELLIQRLLAQEYMQVRDFDKADQHANEASGLVSKLEDNSFETLRINFLKGDIALKGRDFQGAIHFYEKALKSAANDNKGSVLHQLGMVYQEQRNWPKAIEYYQQAIDVNKETGQLHQLGSTYHQLGMVYQEQRNWPKAIEYYQQAIEAKKETGQLHQLGSTYHQLGRVYEEQRNWPKAIEYYQQAIEVKKETGQLHELGGTYHQLGMVYQEQRNWPKAIEYYQQTIEVHKETGQLHELGGTYHQLGTVYEEQRNWQKAIEYYQQAIEADKETGQLHQLGGTYHQLGMVYQEQRNWQKAMEYYQQAIGVNKETGQLHELGSTYHQLGMVYQKQRNLPEAIEYYQQALEVKKETGQLHQLGSTYHQLGMVYEEQENWKESLKWYGMVLENIEQYGNYHSISYLERSLNRMQGKSSKKFKKEIASLQKRVAALAKEHGVN